MSFIIETKTVNTNELRVFFASFEGDGGDVNLNALNFL